MGLQVADPKAHTSTAADGGSGLYRCVVASPRQAFWLRRLPHYGEAHLLSLA